MTEAQLAHLGDDPLPDDVFGPAEAALVRYCRTSTRMATIDEALYAELDAHFDRRQLMELCFEVGLANLVNRFHATFLTDVDPETGEVTAPSCPMPMPEQLATQADDGWHRSIGS